MFTKMVTGHSSNDHQRIVGFTEEDLLTYLTAIGNLRGCGTDTGELRGAEVLLKRLYEHLQTPRDTGRI